MYVTNKQEDKTMKKMTFKTIREKIEANETVKISTAFGWNICKAEEIKIDSKKKIFKIPAFSELFGAYVIPVHCNQVLAIEAA